MQCECPGRRFEPSPPNNKDKTWEVAQLVRAGKKNPNPVFFETFTLLSCIKENNKNKRE